MELTNSLREEINYLAKYIYDRETLKIQRGYTLDLLHNSRLRNFISKHPSKDIALWEYKEFLDYLKLGHFRFFMGCESKYTLFSKVYEKLKVDCNCCTFFRGVILGSAVTAILYFIIQVIGRLLNDSPTI